ncbi:MAG: hypothetical protein AVDCRST_MAG39-1840, partial [uncultured Sphingomonadaceae bacterium]
GARGAADGRRATGGGRAGRARPCTGRRGDGRCGSARDARRRAGQVARPRPDQL